MKENEPMKEENISDNHIDYFKSFCTPGATVEVNDLALTSQISLRIITFQPAHDEDNPPVLFVAGWISLMDGWREVLVELTRHYTVHYMETREKISSRVEREQGYGVEDIGGDIDRVIEALSLEEDNYILAGSSLGATAILEVCHKLHATPRCLALIGPNAAFRIPIIWKIIIQLFYPPFYLWIKPAIKWYLRTFRMQVKSDRAQYEKYKRAINSADPWKLKKAAVALWGYEVWDKLDDIKIPILIVGASKDKLHEPKNLAKMVKMLPHADYVDLETNANTHSKAMVDALVFYLKELN